MRVPFTVAVFTLVLSALHSSAPARVEAAQPQAAFTFARVYPQSTPGLAAPTPINKPNPLYTPQAMQQKIQGPVTLEVTVSSDGNVRDAMVKQSLDPVNGLDDEAVKAASRWTFVPGRLNGQAVPVRLEIKFDMRLH